MKDPERLLSSGASEFERLVLHAARGEQPSLNNRRRMRRALLLAEFGFLATGFKAAASVANQLVVAAIIAGALAGNSSSSSESKPPMLSQVAAVAASPKAGPATVNRASGPVPNQLPPEVLAVPVEELPFDVGGPSVSGKALSRQGSQVKGVDLREEILLLDQARTQLRAGKANLAISTLGRYFSLFARGSFRQEATVLRIEALAISGNQGRAAAEARAFMAKNPKSPHLDKLQRITAIAAGSARR